MKLGINIHYASVRCCKGFQGQRSKLRRIITYNGGVLHFDTVARWLACFTYDLLCDSFVLQPGMRSLFCVMPTPVPKSDSDFDSRTYCATY